MILFVQGIWYHSRFRAQLWLERLSGVSGLFDINKIKIMENTVVMLEHCQNRDRVTAHQLVPGASEARSSFAWPLEPSVLLNFLSVQDSCACPRQRGMNQWAENGGRPFSFFIMCFSNAVSLPRGLQVSRLQGNAWCVSRRSSLCPVLEV